MKSRILHDDVRAFPVADAKTSPIVDVSTSPVADARTIHICEMRTKSKPHNLPPAADFAEVKRRFTRQNRELAKNNSTQSLRNRSRELEVSKLLSDNPDLREQVLSSQNELYDARMQVSSAAA